MKSFCSFLVIEPIILVFEIKFNNNNCPNFSYEFQAQRSESELETTDI